MYADDYADNRVADAIEHRRKARDIVHNLRLVRRNSPFWLPLELLARIQVELEALIKKVANETYTQWMDTNLLVNQLLTD